MTLARASILALIDHGISVERVRALLVETPTECRNGRPEIRCPICERTQHELVLTGSARHAYVCKRCRAYVELSLTRTAPCKGTLSWTAALLEDGSTRFVLACPACRMRAEATLPAARSTSRSETGPGDPSTDTSATAPCSPATPASTRPLT